MDPPHSIINCVKVYTRSHQSNNTVKFGINSSSLGKKARPPDAYTWWSGLTKLFIWSRLFTGFQTTDDQRGTPFSCFILPSPCVPVGRAGYSLLGGLFLMINLTVFGTGDLVKFFARSQVTCRYTIWATRISTKSPCPICRPLFSWPSDHLSRLAIVITLSFLLRSIAVVMM